MKKMVKSSLAASLVLCVTNLSADANRDKLKNDLEGSSTSVSLTSNIQATSVNGGDGIEIYGSKIINGNDLSITGGGKDSNFSGFFVIKDLSGLSINNLTVKDFYNNNKDGGFLFGSSTEDFEGINPTDIIFQAHNSHFYNNSATNGGVVNINGT